MSNIEREYILESEDEEEAEQLEEMRPPLVTIWTGPDGITVHGVICIDHGINRLKNRCRLDDCPICYNPTTTHVKHQICCLPCGHMYGFSCINKWLLQSSSQQCPQCNTPCFSQDAILLYLTRLYVTDHEKEASPTTLFPFTNLGFLQFKKYELSRRLDALLLLAHDTKHKNILVRNCNDLIHRAKELLTQRFNLLTQAQQLDRAESLGPAKKLRRQIRRLKKQSQALKRRLGALGLLVGALNQRKDALRQRADAFESRIIFYSKTYQEHRKREEEIAMKKTLAEKAAAEENNKGEKAAEKKLKDKEKKDEKKIQASDTADVPGEEMVEDVAEEEMVEDVAKEEIVEDVAEEPDEEKVEVKEEPTTKTTERVDSMSMVLHKRKKSNNYYYYAAAVAVLSVPLAAGYTLYAQ